MSTGWVVLLLAVAAGLLSIATFAIGRYSVHRNLAREPSLASSPFNRETSEAIILKFNETFTESTAQTAQAWKEVMPPADGFFNYPATGEGKATFSVYHQLHCLVRPPFVSLTTEIID